MTLHALTIFLAVALTLGASASAAPPEPTSEAQAEAVFDEALALFGEGRFAEACPKFETAIALTKGEGLGGKLMLASCYEKSGRAASAWALFKEVAAKAAQAQQTDREREALAGAERVKSQMHHLVLRVPASAKSIPGVTLKVGRQMIPREAWSTTLPVDAGKVRVALEAPDHRPSLRTVSIPLGPGTTRVSLDAPKPNPNPKPKPKEPVAPALGPLAITGIVVGALGAASLITGIGVGLKAKSDWDDAVERDCVDGDPMRCRSLQGIDDARQTGDIATVFFSAGAGALGVGVAFVIVDVAF